MSTIYESDLEMQIERLRNQLSPLQCKCVLWGHPSKNWFEFSNLTSDEQKLAVSLDCQIKELEEQLDNPEGLTEEQLTEKYTEEEAHEILEMFEGLDETDEDCGFNFDCNASALKRALKLYVESKIKKLY